MYICRFHYNRVCTCLSWFFGATTACFFLRLSLFDASGIYFLSTEVNSIFLQESLWWAVVTTANYMARFYDIMFALAFSVSSGILGFLPFRKLRSRFTFVIYPLNAAPSSRKLSWL